LLRLMERTVLLAAATWVGGVGAWGVGVGYALGVARLGRTPAEQQGSSDAPRHSARMRLGDDRDAPTPPTEVVDVDSLPAPPLPLDMDEDRGRGMRSAAAVPSANSGDVEEFLKLQEARMAGVLDDDPVDDDEPDLTTVPLNELGETALELRPPDASALLTESQRRRLAPIKPLRRERRSRKIRTAGPKDDKFVPLVKGARPTQSEAILNAYTGETLDVKREQGEDYWVDPIALQEEMDAREAVQERRKQFKLREKSFGEGRLREEITAPYKNNVIGLIVVGIGVAAVFFAAFPDLLELNEPPSIASFPDTL